MTSAPAARPSRTARARQAGVTLLEVQVAILLLCVVMLGLTATLATQQRQLTVAERAARLAGSVNLSTRRVVVTRIDSKLGGSTCLVRPVGLDYSQSPAAVKVRVSAP